MFMSRTKNLLTRPLAALFLLSLLTAAIYSNSLFVPFVFDDHHTLVDNSSIRDLRNLDDLSGSRYMGFLSFALNYHFGRLNVFGYHLVNLIIHITNGFLVYGVVLLLFQSISNPRRTSQSKGARDDFPRSQPAAGFGIAWVTALAFVAHPIQTQAVTYTVQRFASLAALFYLLAVFCYLKWRLDPSGGKTRYFWYAAAFLSTIFAMKTKENSFTLPLMILLLESIFFPPTGWKRWSSLIPFLLTLLIIPFSTIETFGEEEPGLAQQTAEIGRAEYLFTQFRVIVTYIRLLFLPIHQNLDYDFPIYHSPFDPPVLLSFLFLLTLLGLSLYLLFSSRLPLYVSRLTAFGLLWFFLALSVESSIIPIRDLIFEHRIYLPSVGLLLAAGTAVAFGLSRWGSAPRWISPGIVSLLILALSVAAYQRNSVWNDEVALWGDAASKSPRKLRPILNLGKAYQSQGRLDEAAESFRSALSLSPESGDATFNLGSVLQEQGRLEEAEEMYRRSLSLKHDLQSQQVQAHNNLGVIYKDQGRIEEAIREFNEAIRRNPDYAAAHYNLGGIYKGLGRLIEASREYRIAIMLQPDDASAHNNLGVVYKDMGRVDDAIGVLRTALALNPDHAPAHNNLGLVYGNLMRDEEAIREYQTALRLKPEFWEASANLAHLFAREGRFEEAVKHYNDALGFNPDRAEIHANLAAVYQRMGRTEEARTHYEQALQIKPDFEAVRKALSGPQK